MRSLIYAVVLSLFFALPAAAQKGAATLSGQVVCSDCWFEADRKTVPYGTEADLKCAARCLKAGIPQALAVTDESGTVLYILESGKLKKSGKDFLELVGKEIEVTGKIREAGKKRYVKVDALKVLSAGGGNQPGGGSGRQGGLQHNAASTDRQSGDASAEPVTLGLKNLQGREQSLSDYRGKIVVLNFWATWCVPCREEMPMLVKLHSKYGPRGIQVIAPSADEPETQEKIAPFTRKMKIDFPVWVGATTAEMKRLGLGEALPATAILDRDGRIVGRILGPLDQKDLEGRVEWLLGDRSTPAPEPLVDNLEKHGDHAGGKDDHKHADKEEANQGGGGKKSASTVPS